MEEANPFSGYFFYKNITYSIKQVRNLSQNAGNDNYRDSNLQKCIGEHAPTSPRRLAPSALVLPLPFESRGSAPAQTQLHILF